ncbi:hypothetical protein EMCG_00642 [[Emmonsia] crescens]|uniref:Killer toxin Kp4 domain-containing protein n=1 Tax=[Emmonsia] crescens TaxID=73230 RepID=A0A0G2IZ20_9EURO|nr:hypothetical protein EMCG_00642 [Emmonsia crescens UAMH 3008]
MKIFFILLIILAIYISALGINCHGSSMCGGTDCSIQEIYKSLYDVPDHKMFASGERLSAVN